MKEKVSVGELHKKKVRGVTVNSPNNLFLHSDLLKLYPEKNIISNISSLKQLSFMIRKLAFGDNEVKR